MPSRLPTEVRRGEFAAVLGRQLERLNATRAKEAELARVKAEAALAKERATAGRVQQTCNVRES